MLVAPTFVEQMKAFGEYKENTVTINQNTLNSSMPLIYFPFWEYQTLILCDIEK